MNGQGLSGNRTMAGCPQPSFLGAMEPRDFALLRAKFLGAVNSFNPSVFDDPFVIAPFLPGSPWQRAINANNGTSVGLINERSGVARLQSSAPAGSDIAATVGPTSGPIPGLISDPGVDGSFWYLLWIFRVPAGATVDNLTGLQIKFVPTSGLANQLFFGVDGQFESVTNFMAEENLVSATISTVAISPGSFHYMEAWQRGVANEIFFGFDGETPLTLIMTAPFNHSGTLQLNCGSSLGGNMLDTDHVTLVMDGNIQLG